MPVLWFGFSEFTGYVAFIRRSQKRPHMKETTIRPSRLHELCLLGRTRQALPIPISSLNETIRKYPIAFALESILQGFWLVAGTTSALLLA